MFFGTPHRGMAIENLLDAMEATGAIEERKELVKAIDHNCTSLQDELKDFIKLAPGIKICTFTETYQTAQVIVVSPLSFLSL